MPDLNPKPKDTKNFDLSQKNLSQLLARSRRRKDPEKSNKRILFLVGVLLSPVSFIGALLGYVHAYNRFMDEDIDPPFLSPLKPIIRASMIIGAVLIWIVLWLSFFLLARILFPTVQDFYFVIAYVGFNLIVCFVAWNRFQTWQDGILNAQYAGDKFGSARYAKPHELEKYVGKNGFYLGGNYTFSDKGHILTVAGTRGGKGTSLIIPNLLGLGGYEGSWVVIDPKGENAAITARYQRSVGQDVVVLNPWGLLEDNIGEGHSYNPLDILRDKNNVNLIDDIQIIAEMIVPIDRNERDKFFTDNARSVIAGLLLHLAIVQPDATTAGNYFYEPPTDGPVLELKTLWEWARLPKKQWVALLEEMQCAENEMYSNSVLQAGNEIEKLMAAGDRTWGAIIAVVLQSTDFLKSPALQKCLRTGFDPITLSDGKTSMYIIIPADKLQSHSRWLRLVVTTTMRAVVRKPQKRVCFLLDEFSALGYLPEIEVALSTYAGFEITVWPILQSLVQLQAHYSDTWETFIGNSNIRQFFSTNDNFTAEYVSNAVGMSTYMQKHRVLGIITRTETHARLLLTPDEVRRGSGDNIFAFFGEKPITYYPKKPYYEMDELKDRADLNPYFETAVPKSIKAEYALPEESLHHENSPAENEITLSKGIERVLTTKAWVPITNTEQINVYVTGMSGYKSFKNLRLEPIENYEFEFDFTAEFRIYIDVISTDKIDDLIEDINIIFTIYEYPVLLQKVKLWCDEQAIEVPFEAPWLEDDYLDENIDK